MTGRIYRPDNVHSLSDIRTRRIHTEEQQVLNAYWRYLHDQGEDGYLNDNIRLAMGAFNHSQNGIGWGGALELLYKLGRELNGDNDHLEDK